MYFKYLSTVYIQILWKSTRIKFRRLSDWLKNDWLKNDAINDPKWCDLETRTIFNQSDCRKCHLFQNDRNKRFNLIKISESHARIS